MTTAASLPGHGGSNLPICGACGSTIWPGNYHSCRKPVEHPKGWQCPVCGTVYAPTVPNCHNSHQPPAKAATGANEHRATAPKLPRVVIAAGRCGGEPTVGDTRIPAELVAGVYWQHGMGAAESQWEPYVDRNGVLVACWYMARYGTRTWRKRWATWLETADYELWHTDPDRWNACPEPPTVTADEPIEQVNP